MNKPKYNGHLYKWSKPFSAVYHNWELRSVHGGIQFHVTMSSESTSCGLEMHSVYPIGDRAPDHINCPITGGRCWHDGASMYANDHLWPLIEPYLKDGFHETIFRILEEEAEKLAEYAPPPAAPLFPVQ